MKQRFILIFLSALLLGCFLTGTASEVPQNLEQTQSSLLPSNAAGASPVQVLFYEGVFYSLATDDAVYHWKMGQQEPALFCRLPENPYRSLAASTADYGSLDTEDRGRLQGAESFLAVSDGKLLGINQFSGKIGELQEGKGIEWSDTHLQASAFLPEGSAWPLRVASAFVSGKTLHVFASHDNGDYPQNNYSLISFDLSDGKARSIPLDGVQGICPMDGDTSMALVWEDAQTQHIHLLDLGTGTLSPSVYVPPTVKGSQMVGGLAYDPLTRQAYCTADGQVWLCRADGSSEAIAAVSSSRTLGETPAWFTEGFYAIFDQQLLLCPLHQQEAPETLAIYGTNPDAITHSFAAAHPEHPVIYHTPEGWLTAGDLSDRMLGRDDAWDIYEVVLDNAFIVLKNKGFCQPFESALLTNDVQAMYPVVQQALQTRKGRPAAYPHKLYTGEIKVNPGLWQLIFGDVPLPESYADFFEAMLRFEQDHSMNHPQLDFVTNFDGAAYVTRVMNAYAQQTAQADTSISYNHQGLKDALTKLFAVCQARVSGGKSIEYAEDRELGMAAIFEDSGLNHVLVEPALSRINRTELYEGVDIYMSEKISPFVFEAGQMPPLPGKMTVMFINPFSRHRALAEKYLEHAARVDNNPRVLYALHPDYSEPVANPQYEQKRERLADQKIQILEALEKTAGSSEKQELEDELAYLNHALNDKEAFRWLISSDTISKFRKQAAGLRFFEDNPYLIDTISPPPVEFERIIRQFVQGHIRIEDFLSQFEGMMRLKHLEGQ